ncbi:unnamed protein product [Discosporangium mesarthrocarpum]
MLGHPCSAFIAPTSLPWVCSSHPGMCFRRSLMTKPFVRCTSRDDVDGGEEILEHSEGSSEGKVDTPETMGGDELQDLLASLNLGSLGKSVSKKQRTRSDIDEVQVINSLRKELGEEDFRRIFDPRNRFIGEW